MNLPPHMWLKGIVPAEIVIMAGVHGNERAGVTALKNFLNSYFISQLKKSVLFILANPRAYEKEARFTETDMNREFRVFSDSYEGKRAREISLMLENVKVLINLHQTQAPTQEPFVSSVKHLPSTAFLQKMQIPVSHFVIISQINSGNMSSDEYLLSLHPKSVALTFECGSIVEEQEKVVALGEKIILEALRYSGALDAPEKEQKKKIQFWTIEQNIPRTPQTQLITGLENFSILKKGQVLAYEKGKEII